MKLFFTVRSVIFMYNISAHLESYRGTPVVCHGSQFENHCSAVTRKQLGELEIKPYVQFYDQHNARYYKL